MTKITKSKLLRTIGGRQWRLADGAPRQERARTIAKNWRHYKYMARVIRTGKDLWPWSVYVRGKN